jgi:hypothetical protein
LPGRERERQPEIGPDEPGVAEADRRGSNTRVENEAAENGKTRIGISLVPRLRFGTPRRFDFGKTPAAELARELTGREREAARPKIFRPRRGNSAKPVRLAELPQLDAERGRRRRENAKVKRGLLAHAGRRGNVDVRRLERDETFGETRVDEARSVAPDLDEQPIPKLRSRRMRRKTDANEER